MSAAPEGVAYLSRSGLKTDSFDPRDDKQFCSHILVDIGLNCCDPSKRPAGWTHPREDGPNGNFPYYQWTVMYGRDAQKISRVRRICADWDKHKKPTEAGLLPVPMPRGEERYFWMDLTFPVRGIYFPLSPMAPPPYRDLCTYVRLDFKHRNIDIPFARPFRYDIIPELYHENLKFEIEKARLAIGPDKTTIKVKEEEKILEYGIVPGQADELQGLYLHPYLRGTPAYSADLKNALPTSEFFQDKDDATQASKKMTESWLAASDRVPVPDEEKKWVKHWNEFATKHQLQRTHDHDRLEVTGFKGQIKSVTHNIPGRFGAPEPTTMLNGRVKDDNEILQNLDPFTVKSYWRSFDVAIMGKVDYTEKEESPRKDEFISPIKAIMTAPDRDPDALVCGTVPFETTTEWGLSIRPQVTLRFDVKALQTLLSIPELFRQPRQYDGPSPLDVYAQNLVLAFGAEEVSIANTPEKEGYNYEYSMNKVINYTDIIRGEFGLTMQYVPGDKEWWEHLANFAIQVISVLADLVPVIGPFLNVAIYLGGNMLLDGSWKCWDNCSPPVIASMISHRKGVIKWTKQPKIQARKLVVGLNRKQLIKE